MGEARLEDLKIGKPKLKWLENVEKDIRAMDMKRWRQRTREREREREREEKRDRQKKLIFSRKSIPQRTIALKIDGMYQYNGNI